MKYRPTFSLQECYVKQAIMPSLMEMTFEILTVVDNKRYTVKTVFRD